MTEILPPGPVAGLACQLALLAGIAATVGLGRAGWLAGAGYGVVACAALARGLRRRGTGGLGPADRVTLARAVLVGGVTASTVDALAGLGGTPPGSPLAPGTLAVVVGLAAVALALDAVDGWVARRTGTVSALGARFDMETDAFLIAVLSCGLAPVVGGWVLAIGGMRYAFVAASWVLPWMRGSLPPRYWRKVVAAVQGVTLVVATSGVLPAPATAVVLAGALVLLAESFGRDVRWLWRQRIRSGEAGRRTRPGEASRSARPGEADRSARPGEAGRRVRPGRYPVGRRPSAALPGPGIVLRPVAARGRRVRTGV